MTAIIKEHIEMTHTKYRFDIDGLRAIAILLVVGFHNFPHIVQGGFVGVDIFFVISGFLISMIILKEVKEDTFSYINFYTRRIKRIFPALIVILLACLFFGYFIDFPDELMLLGKHIAGSAIFAANLIFYRESGYFDISSELKPLLHLWSLGIEEQYYILWPFLVVVFYKWNRSFLPVILFFLILSFLINIMLVANHPEAAFYLPITRFWELLVGSMLAFITLEHKLQAWLGKYNDKLNYNVVLKFQNICAWLGLVLIITSIFFITEHNHFPGFWALLPIIGTFFIILAGQNAWLNKHILANTIFVFFGLISYPLYLWHWVLLSFFRMMGEDPSLQMRICIITISIILAWITYRFIEKPIRFGKQTRIKPIALIASLVLMVMIGIYLRESGGLPNRSFMKNQNMLANDLMYNTSKLPYPPCPAELKNSEPKLNYCLQSRNSRPISVVFGDSHAEHIFYGIAKTDSVHNWLLVGNSSCMPLTGVTIEGGDVTQCQERTKNIISYINSQDSIHTIVLSFFGNVFKDTSFAADHLKSHNGPSPRVKIIGNENNKLQKKVDLFKYGIEKTVTELESKGKNIIIVIDVPELPFFPRDCIPRLFKHSVVTECSISKLTVLKRQDQLRALLKDIKKSHPNIRIFDPLTFLCDDHICRVKLDNILVYRDSHHLSIRGGELYAKYFIPWLYQDSKLLDKLNTDKLTLNNQLVKF